MEVEVQAKKVIEHVSSDFANCLLGDTGKDCIPQFLEDSCSNAGCAIYRALSAGFF